MVSPRDPKLQQSIGAAGLAGCWKLAPKRALSLRPREDGVLLVTQGQAWATLDVPHCGRGNQLGDHCLHAGQQLRVRARQHLVIESLDDAPVHFDWTPDAPGPTPWDFFRQLRIALGALAGRRA